MRVKCMNSVPLPGTWRCTWIKCEFEAEVENIQDPCPRCEKVGMLVPVEKEE